MLCEYTAKGKTIDEAVANGLEKLGLERDDVSIEVLETPEKGFLGIGATPAVVKITYDGVAPVIEDAAPAEVEDKKAAKAAEKAAKAAEKAAEKAAKTAEKQKKSAKKGESACLPANSVEFVTEMIRLMGYDDVTVDSSVDENGLSITLGGENAGSLIGHRGETLNAIQYLVSLFENRSSEDYERVNFDILGYREKRKATLEKLARRMAVQAVKTRRNVYLDPMPNYERKIIHSSLQDFVGVNTYSTGSEPNRKVVIAYNGERRDNKGGSRGPRRRFQNGGYSNSGFAEDKPEEKAETNSEE